MNVHKNATLTPRGRAALVRLVTHQGLSVSAASARIGVSRTTVYRWLCRATEFGDRSSRPRRLARLHPPGELLHVDVKKLARITRGPGHRIHGDRRTRVAGAGWEYAHVAIDDASRFAYVELLPDETAVTATGFLHRALRWYWRRRIRVERVMTDNAKAYHSHVHTAATRAAGVRQRFTRPYRPCTNGKAERFIRTLLTE